MRILLANYRYFVSSGPERYLFNIKRRLENLGHSIFPFSINYSLNQPSSYSKYFVSPLAGPDEVYFDQHRKTAGAVAKTLSRLFYSAEVERAVGRMADDLKPDVAYILYYLRKLSPSLLVGIKKRGIPIVVRISDYGMMCGEHHMLRDEKPCTLCLDRGLWSEVQHRCIKGSLAVSALDAIATSFHRSRGYFDLIDRFVTTNEFMSEMMVRAGVPRERILCNPTFTDMERFHPAEGPSQPPYLLYVGRLDRPKGVHLLVEAMALLRERLGDDLPVLRIAGAGHTRSYVDAVKARVRELDLTSRIEFLGAVPADETPALFRGAYASLMPALWYENLPNSVVESFASGCPVIASDIGSLSATVTDGQDGLHHRPDDPADLARQILRLVVDPALRDRLSRGARATAEQAHSPDEHVRRLLDLFGQLAGSPTARELVPA